MALVAKTPRYEVSFNNYIQQLLYMEPEQFWKLPMKTRVMLFESFVRCKTATAKVMHYYSPLWINWGILHFDLPLDGCFNWRESRRRRGLFLKYACLSCVTCADGANALKPYQNIDFDTWFDNYIASIEFTKCFSYGNDLSYYQALFEHKYNKRALNRTYNIFCECSSDFKYAPMPLELFHYIAVPHENDILWSYGRGYFMSNFRYYLHGYDCYLRDFAKNEAMQWLEWTECKNKKKPDSYYGFMEGNQ